jgi:cysteine synthase A
MSGRGILAGVGSTPMIELARIVPDGAARVLIKLESANPTGSMKDRMAAAVLDGAARRNELAPGGTVVEYTAGTTGVSLAFACAALGYRLHVVFSDAFSVEKRRTMQAYGAQITDVPSDEGRINETLIKAMIARAAEIGREPGHWWADQLNNQDAASGYHGLGHEIAQQADGEVAAFVHAVSTSHSLHGVTEGLRQCGSRAMIVAVEPEESAVLSGRPTGSHKIEGIGIEFLPPLWRREMVDEIQTVTTADAESMARRLCREEGLFAGTSTGANVVAALRIAERLGPGATVVTLAVDSGLRYLSTQLFAG